MAGGRAASAWSGSQPSYSALLGTACTVGLLVTTWWLGARHRGRTTVSTEEASGGPHGWLQRSVQVSKPGPCTAFDKARAAPPLADQSASPAPVSTPAPALPLFSSLQTRLKTETDRPGC